MRILPLMAIASLLAISSAGCQKKYIPNTEIEDNEENREVVAFCERYRHAVEDLNIGLLVSMASPRYFDNSGTINGDDDFDKAGLESVLAERFKSIRAMRYEIKYRDVYECEMKVCVDYSYTMSFQYTIGDKTKWANKTADNRLELEEVDGGFLVVSGM